MKQFFQTFVCGFITWFGVSSVALSDDTEIFFTQGLSSGEKSGNILFMFDTSGSLYSNDGEGEVRMNSLKKAMLEIIDSGTNVRMGIGAFNGEFRGASILTPMIGLDEDRCPNQNCDIVHIRGRISQATDDGRELATGEVILDEESITIGQYADSSDITSTSYSEQISENDALEYPDGTLDITSDTLITFGTDPNNVPSLGMRFPDVDVPLDATIISSDIMLFSSGDAGNSGRTDIQFRVDATPQSPVFANAAGQRVNDRPTIPGTVDWLYFTTPDTYNGTRRSPDLTSIVEARINQPDWVQGDPMTLILDDVNPAGASNGDTSSWRSYDENGASRLQIKYTTEPMKSQTVGLRFSDLNIPRGATITHASLVFAAHASDTKDTTVTITAEDIGDATPFTNASGNLSSRTKTTGVSSVFPHWLTKRYRYGDVNVMPVVQSVVNRADWCGGNSMALFLDGEGVRKMRTFEVNQFEAPMLKVSYDASTVQYGSSCSRKRDETQLVGVQNDAVENSAGSLAINGGSLATHDGLAGNLIGLRFTNIDVPEGATISNASLRFKSAAESGEQPSVNISGELSVFSSTFDSSQVNNLSGRDRTIANVDWDDIPDENTRESIRSVDIGDVVEEIIGQVGWQTGNPVTLLLAGDSSDSGLREFLSLDGGGDIALVINYSVDGADFTSDNIALIEGRDETINSVLDLWPLGATQLVDSLYESAAYLTGAPVDYGKIRGEQGRFASFYRVSTPDSYTGGTVVRDPSCSEINLDHESCVTEIIDGSPIYTQIEPGQCQATQLVVLTDGQATVNTAEDRIKALTGVSSCVDRTTSKENCGVELASWLKNTDHFDTIEDIQPIITNTVGFNFSSPFLADLATAGGGEFINASSASDLVDAFTSIIEAAADTTTSFTPPAVSISQSNRLTNSDNLYFSLFNPSKSVKWDGNLKKYKLGALATAPDDIIILDEDGEAAFDESTGGFDDNARSFWSTQTDGGNVAEGGAASKIATPRKVLTYVDADATTEPLINLDENNTQDLTADLFNIDAADTDYRNQVIQWARGVDVKDWDGDGNITELRLQMGDPLHSSPAVIDYDNKSVLYVGTNEGFLHGIDVSDGTEVFSFIPKALLGNLPQYFENAGDSTRPYGLDGPITTWIEDTNGNNKVDNGEKAYLVVGMRRGGRNYYALDISNPDAPKLKWVIEGGAGDYTELGQTWSKPIKTKIRSGVTEKDVLIFAAGYDTGNDIKDTRNNNDTMGRGIFIVDALSGDRIAYEAPITNTDLQYAIPSDIRAIDINLDSYIDSIFVGDLGGQLWRFDLNNDNSGVIDTALTGGVIADLGGNDSENFRRFFYEPDVSLLNGGEMGEFLNIAIGSGVRSNPLNQTVKDRLYVVRDFAVFGPPVNADGDITYTKLTENDLFDASLLSGATDTTGKIRDGWMIKLSDSGEKVLSKAVTINGQVLYTTYLPGMSSIGSCGLSLGSGRVYAVSATYADALVDLDGSESLTLTLDDRSTNLTAPGIPPNASALIPESSPDAPVVLVGSEVLPNIDFGDLFKRTYWAEN